MILIFHLKIIIITVFLLKSYIKIKKSLQMMNYSYIFLIAISLGMDAFAVSISGGAYFGRATKRQKFRLSFHFGLFQLLMPVVGWIIGAKIVNLVKDYDHWIAMIILSLIGAKMIFDGIKNDDGKIFKDISKGWLLVTLAFATSIDALAVGFSFGVIDSKIFIPSIIIGIIASIMSLIGIKLGELLSFRFGRKIEILGGIILIIIGINIVIQHTF